MISHMRKHLDLIFGVCYLCNKRFKRSNEFKLHFNVHSKRDRSLNEAAMLLLE